MEIVFLILLFLSVYSYLFYPLFLSFLSIFAKDTWDKEDIQPTVSIIISAYNEEAVIEEKVRNALAVYAAVGKSVALIEVSKQIEQEGRYGKKANIIS